VVVVPVTRARFVIQRTDGAYYLGRDLDDLEGEWWNLDGDPHTAAYWLTADAAEDGLRAIRQREVKSGSSLRVDARVVEVEAIDVA
jgi:hypothetical protein